MHLDDVFYSGEWLGSKLKVGDLITIILTSVPQDEAMTITKDEKMVINVPKEKMIATTIKYSAEIDELFSFYVLLEFMQKDTTKKGNRFEERDVRASEA